MVSANNSRISSNTPVYVTGFERGVLPIGSWVMWTTLSTFSKPVTSLQSPTTTLDL